MLDVGIAMVLMTEQASQTQRYQKKEYALGEDHDSQAFENRKELLKYI